MVNLPKVPDPSPPGENIRARCPTTRAAAMAGQDLPGEKKRAYRHLLYLALLEVRRMDAADCSVHRPALVADWLHNLALFSSRDFAGFDENVFWRSGEHLSRQCPGALESYRAAFEASLSAPAPRAPAVGT